MPHVFDTSDPPLVHAVFRRAISADETRDYIDKLGDLLRRGVRFGVLLDATEVRVADRGSLLLFRDFYKQHREACQRQWVGLAMILGSPVLRFMLTSLLIMVPLP